MACESVSNGFGFTRMDPTITDALAYIHLEFFLLVAVTHFFHFGLKRLGQPIVISAILAGMVTGETGLRRARILNSALRQANEDILNTFAERTGASFMFLIALNLELKYKRTRNRSLIIASASAVIPLIGFLIFLGFMNFENNLIGTLFFVHTSSPIAIRIITELKLVSMEIGQLAIVSALANDLACIVIVMFSDNIPLMRSGKIKAWRVCMTLLMIAVILVVLRPFVRWLNRRNLRRRYIRNYQLLFIICFLVWLVFITESGGINGTFVCFLMGLVFPRDGATIRTLRDKLRYPIHNLILPVYFGWTSSRIDIIDFFKSSSKINMTMGVTLRVAFSVIAKVGGTVAAGTYLKIPFQESLSLGFILNVKGNVDVLSVSMAKRQKYNGVMSTQALTILLMTMIINTLTAGVAGRILASKKERAFKRDVAQGLRQVELEKELHVLACVYNPIEVPSILTLARLSINGVPHNPFSILLLHLVGLPKNYNSHTLFYNQRHHKDDYDDEDSLGHEYKDAPRINACVDDFTKETSTAVRQVTLASFFDKMHKLLCQDIYDYHRTLVLIPSHKEQRYDGKMVCRKEERRRLNLKVLKEAPCTVGILMDRPVTGGILPGSKEIDTNTDCLTPMSSIATSDLHHVVAIFCGGPDDQEALEYSGRLAMHPHTDVTVLRFLTSTSRSENVSPHDRISTASSSISSEIAMIIHKDDEERYLDDEFMIKFQQRFVAPGNVKYIEKYANNGTEIEAVMKSMVGMYSLFIIGRGRQPTAMLAGLTEWQECIEIGPIGDMLSSDAFMNCGSVLIIQRPRNRSTNKENSLIESMFQ